MEFHQTENEYVILRPLALPDADQLRDLFDHPLSLPKTREMVQALLDSDKTVLAVIDPNGKTPRGLVEISGDDGQTVTIGYRIRTPYRNMHYGSEAVYLLCRCLCEKHGIKRIKALVKKDNEWSLRLLRHNGFEKTGETETEEQYVYYSKEKAGQKHWDIPDNRKMICAAGGCFWGTERIFRILDGVCATECGYANGHTENPHYEDVCRRDTGYREAVMITYDPEKISLRKLMKAFFMCIDPTVANRQGEDEGSQYQTGVYYLQEEDRTVLEQYFDEERRKHDTFFVELEPLENYYTAEEYHQKYLDKNPNGYCHISPAKLADVRRLNEEDL